MDNKFLVTFFAQKGRELTGNSAKIAAKVIDQLRKKGIDPKQFTITPVETYPTDHDEFEAVVKAELSAHSRPAIVGKLSGMKEVEKIVLIVPNWRAALPPAVNTFLDEYDFNNKRIVLIVSHEGDGGKDIEGELRKFLPKTWIMPVVEIEASKIESSEDKIEKAVEELFSE